MKDSQATRRLIRAAQAGDERAFEALLYSQETGVYRVALSILGRREDAEDAAQETWIKLWQTLPQYRFECPFTPYVLRMARNTALDHLRRRAARGGEPLPLAWQDEEEGETPLDLPDPDPYADPSEAYLRTERIEIVRGALQELPAAAREILMLKEWQGLSYEQIASVLGVEMGTVKSRIARAREKLARLLKKRNIW